MMPWWKDKTNYQFLTSRTADGAQRIMMPVQMQVLPKYLDPHRLIRSQIYTFKNIRFAAPPTGDLRWAKPTPPKAEMEVQTGENGGSYYQSLPPGILYAALAGGLAPAAQSDGTLLGGLLAWIQSKAVQLLGSM